MSLKFEAVISVWEDGLFVVRDKIEALDTDSLKEQIEISIDTITSRLDDIQERRKKALDDDDIPF